MATDEGARTHHCVRLFCIIDALTITSVLPGIDDIIDEYRTGIARTGHAHARNMSGFAYRSARSLGLGTSRAARLCECSCGLWRDAARSGAMCLSGHREHLADL